MKNKNYHTVGTVPKSNRKRQNSELCMYNRTAFNYTYPLRFDLLTQFPIITIFASGTSRSFVVGTHYHFNVIGSPFLICNEPTIVLNGHLR